MVLLLKQPADIRRLEQEDTPLHFTSHESIRLPRQGITKDRNRPRVGQVAKAGNDLQAKALILLTHQSRPYRLENLPLFACLQGRDTVLQRQEWHLQVRHQFS
ncbi:hypothetical protein D7X12_19390 [Corallococcus sicarius]|uniref:Uncharacterized protein n=1 Tax=Corallococcus sicarius TaxID=2316726 RepID=A0A3A8NIM9_9BACT|nr:hypothetical protein D7X12_19390 [Corallococcus sicarius]